MGEDSLIGSSMKTRKELEAELERSPTRLADLERARADREQLAGALRESDERFKLAVRGSSDGLWHWHVATGDVWWSHRYRELIGYEDDELPASYESWESLLHPDDRERTLKALREHLEEGQAYDIECRMRTKHDEYRWFLARGVATRDETGKAVRMAGSIQDISERKRVQERLTETAEQLEHLLKTGPMAIYRCEPRADYPATFISENVKNQLGYEAHEFTDDPRFWARHIHPDDAPRVFSEISTLFERGHHTHEYRFLHEDGSYRWMLPLDARRVEAHTRRGGEPAGYHWQLDRHNRAQASGGGAAQDHQEAVQSAKCCQNGLLGLGSEDE
jgi:PAS domain S-box-containing protein